MKAKSAEKTRHVVPWRNKAEWDQVLEYLFSSDTSLQKYALHRVSAWQSRCAHNMPVAIDCTADLVRCQVLDRGAQLDARGLALAYGSPLVRFVNLITERQQGRVARPLRRLAGKLNIPEWLVNLRHDFTHRKLPTLKWCRKGCGEALGWLQREYWSRQLRGNDGDWGQTGDEEEEDGEDETARLRDMETYKKIRELLIAYENEQYQVLEGNSGDKETWPAPFAEMSWLLAEIKQLALDSCDLLVDVLLDDGFLVPTPEQLDTLGCGAFDPTDASPKVPPNFLRFWLPLLKMLNSVAFIHLFLEKLFAELKLLCDEPFDHRAFYISAWISEVVLSNAKKRDHLETKGQRKARLRDRIFVSRVQLRWEQLLTACLESPCVSTPHLLQLILADMEHPLPFERQEKLLKVCSLYTQKERSPMCSPRRDQPIYTLESLQEKLRQSRQRRSRELERSSSTREMSDTDADKVRLLRGSPWQLCTDNVNWKNYPLGKVPGQSDEPNGLMLENYTPMVVLDQPVDMEAPLHSPSRASAAAKSERLIWSASDVARLKSGIKLF